MDSEDEHGSEDGEATPDSGSDDETVFVTGHVFNEEENDEEGGAEDNQEIMTDGNRGVGGGSVSHKETSVIPGNTGVDADIAADKGVIGGGRVPVKTELQSPDKFNVLLSSVISSPSQTQGFEGNNLASSTLEGEEDVEMEEEVGLGPPAIISIRKNIFEEDEEPEQVISSESNPILPAPTQTPAVPCSNTLNISLSAQPLPSGSGVNTTEATNKVPDKVSNKKSVSSLRLKRLSRVRRNLIKKNSFGACNCESMWKKERSVKNRLLSKIKDLTGAVLELTKRHTLLEDFVHVKHEEEFRTFAREHDQLRTLGFEERDPDITKRPETWREGGSNVVDLLTASKYGEEFVDELGKKKPKTPKQSTAQFWTEKLANIGLPGPPDPNKSSKQNKNSEKDSTQSRNTSKDRSETREEENRKRPRLNDNETSSPPLKKRNETEGITKPAPRNRNESSSNVNPFYQQQEYAFEQGFTAGPSGGGWGHGWDPSPSSFGDQFNIQNQMNPSIFPMQSTNNNSVQMGGGFLQGFPQGQESYQQQQVQFIQNQMIPEQFPMQSTNIVQMGGGFQQGPYQEEGCWDNTIPYGPDPSTGFYDTGPTSPPQEFYPDPSTDIGIKRKTRRSRGKKNKERSSTAQSTSSSIPETGAIVGKRPPLFPEMPDNLTEEQIATLRRIYKPNERFIGESRKQYRERILRKIGVKTSNKQNVQIPNGKTFRQVFTSVKSSSKGQSSSSAAKASASNPSKSNKPLASSASCPDLDGDEPSVGVQKLVRLPPNLPLSKLNIIDRGDSIGPLTRSGARSGANNTNTNTSLEGNNRNEDNGKDPDAPVVITL